MLFSSRVRVRISAYEMTHIVLGGALNSTHSPPGLGLDSVSGVLVSCYAHVFVRLYVVIVTDKTSCMHAYGGIMCDANITSTKKNDYRLFPSHLAHRVALISGSKALCQTPTEAAGPWPVCGTVCLFTLYLPWYQIIRFGDRGKGEENLPKVALDSAAAGIEPAISSR